MHEVPPTCPLADSGGSNENYPTERQLQSGNFMKWILSESAGRKSKPVPDRVKILQIVEQPCQSKTQMEHIWLKSW